MAETSIGERIREALLERGYRRDDGEPDVRNFAFDHRFDKGHMYSWMNNKMKPFKQIVELCRALDISVDWLLTGVGRGPKASPGRARQHGKLKSLWLVLPLAAGALLSPSAGRAAQTLPRGLAEEIVPLLGSRRLLAVA
jgi:hypothetical protein